MITVFLALLILVPSQLVFAPLGGVGKPAVVFGLGCGVVWLVSRITPGHAPGDTQPIRVALYVFVIVYLLAYLLGHARGLPSIEGLASDRSVLLLLSMTGVALLLCDLTLERTDVDTILRRMVILSTVLAVTGILQFKPGIDVVEWIRIPGLTVNRDFTAIGTRGTPGFTRIQGTATHPIEFSVTLAMVLPIATHFALFARTIKDRATWWLMTGTILTAIMFSLSRSGILGLAVGMGALILVWNNRLRAEALIVAVVGAGVFKAVLPGLIGTIRSLFLNFGTDPSVQGRTDDYANVGKFISERPWFGRGPRTFLPERYFALDNQFLDTLITTGWIGIASLVTLFLVSIFVARGLYHRAADEETRHLGQALTGSFLAALVTSFTFDSLSFVNFFGVLFVLIGVAGALRRLAPEVNENTPMPTLVRLRRPPLPPRLRRWRGSGSSNGPP